MTAIHHLYKDPNYTQPYCEVDLTGVTIPNPNDIDFKDDGICIGCMNIQHHELTHATARLDFLESLFNSLDTTFNLVTTHMMEKHQAYKDLSEEQKECSKSVLQQIKEM